MKKNQQTALTNEERLALNKRANKETKSQKLFKQLLANVTCECSAAEKEDALKDGMACHCMMAPSSWGELAYEAIYEENKDGSDNHLLADQISNKIQELADLLIQDTAKGYM